MSPSPIRLTDSYWHADRTQPLLETTLGGLIRHIAGEVPDRLAFVECGVAGQRREWTYGDLLRSGEAVAKALLQQFRPGERIAVWAPNGAEWVLLQHGAAFAGLVLVTVNPAYQAAELRHVLGASEAAGIVHAGHYRGVDMGATVEKLRPELPKLRAVLSLSDWHEFLATSAATLPLPEVRPGDMVQIQFTSGTTGRPKGACLHHRGIINAARFTAQRAGFARGGRWATAMPLFHVGGCAGSEIGAMSGHGTFVLLTAFEAGAMLELIERERINHLHAVPTMLIAMLEHPRLAHTDLSSLQTVMSGGSPVPETLVQRVRETFGCKFTITFGQTELNGVICQTHPEDTPTRVSTTIGQPSPQMDLKIADPATGDVMPLGQPGEIWARGYQTMLGYFNAPPGSDPALLPDGWLRTGDQAAMDGAGYLQITGRLKDCIIRGGENIYPREVEDALLTHPLVQQASVVGIRDAQLGECVAAVLRFKPGEHPPDTTELHHHCRERLAAYKTPAHWFYVEDYPATASGKIQKFVLRDRIVSGEMRPQPFDKPARDRARA